MGGRRPKGRRRNKAQRRSKLTSERRFQRRLGKGKVTAKTRDRWFTLDDAESEYDKGIERMARGLVPDGHPLSPYRVA